MLPTRLVVVSDLHLGGSHLPMMSRPPELDAFIHGLRGGLKTDERLELLCSMLVRAYDPCISCSVHMLDVKFTR